jgi:O-acetyl-ADP-ribose deacetylase (regulator of RNase III)
LKLIFGTQIWKQNSSVGGIPLPTMTKLVKGDILTAVESEILTVHQVNSKTHGSAKGLAKTLFDRYPQADVYRDNSTGLTPGTILVRGNIVNLVGQRYPGSSQHNNDTELNRETWFQHGLRELSSYIRTHGITQVAFPWMIGCGLAGGNWSFYEKAISEFAYSMPGVDVFIYQLPG